MDVFITSFFVISLVCLSASFSCGQTEPEMGVCYGQLGDNLPAPSESVELIRKLNAKRIKIYDANPEILEAFRGTNLRTMIMIPNDLIPGISNDQALADQWVQQNVVPYYNSSNIDCLLVGNKVLSNERQTMWRQLVPAMDKIQNAVQKFHLHNIKVGTPLEMNVLESPDPPSDGAFSSDVRYAVIKPLLEFLIRTKSFFFVDVYTYFDWASDPNENSLDYALLKSTKTTKDPATGLLYTDPLDKMLDAIVFAMKKLGYPEVPLFISETGWPSDGASDRLGVNIYNAATYNRNVVKKFATKPPKGIPSRPGAVIPTMIFALYNAENKLGKGTDRNFGLLSPDGSPVYPIDLSGNNPELNYPLLPNTMTKNKLWCVVTDGSDEAALTDAMTFACKGSGICDAILPGGNCYEPNTLINHASYAFSSNWATMKVAGRSCYFNGLAVMTTTNPSYGSCEFPSADA